jgi:hypothetical protein
MASKQLPASLLAGNRPTGRLRFREGARATPRTLARDIGARAFTTLYRRMLLMSYQLDRQRINPYPAAIDVQFSHLGEGDIDAYLRFRPRADAAEVRARLERGQTCITSWFGKDIVDAGWIATGAVWVPYMNRQIVVEPGDIYTYDSYTSPGFRGRGIHAARSAFAGIQNQKDGLKRSISLVAFENYSAWFLLTYAGLETLGCYHYLRTPLRGIYWETPEPGKKLPQLVTRPPHSSRILQQPSRNLAFERKS